MGVASWDSKDVAEQRRKGAAERSRHMAEVTAKMFGEAGITGGMRVLELGAGTGEMALLLSERVGPRGTVVATDASVPMVDVAREVVKARGATNVVHEVCDAAAVALAEASFDAVVARNLLMFLDLDAALPTIRRVMREGARFGAAVWGPVENNPFHGLVLAAARAEGGWGDRRMELATAFARGQAATYVTSFAKAGFRDVRTGVVRVTRRYPDVAAARAAVLDSPIHTAPILALDPGRQASAWTRVEEGYAELETNGAIEIPAEWLVVGGTR
ncbi:MAG: class I SAM-dependent methyltransferase [Polyangiaceae bacterium]